LPERRFRALPLIVWTAVVVGVVSFLAPQSSAKRDAGKRVETFDRVERVRIEHLIVDLRHRTWRWQAVMGTRRTQVSPARPQALALAYRRWVLEVWKQRARAARRLAHHPPRLKDWLCIHRYEGSWTDPNPPYYGGLQMDLGFQRTYARGLLRRKGTAEHWTPLEQIWTAERAYRSGRGFYPWPNTARFCGLI
jgi:hypothetical protein